MSSFETNFQGPMFSHPSSRVLLKRVQLTYRFRAVGPRCSGLLQPLWARLLNFLNYQLTEMNVPLLTTFAALFTFLLYSRLYSSFQDWRPTVLR